MDVGPTVLNIDDRDDAFKEVPKVLLPEFGEELAALEGSRAGSARQGEETDAVFAMGFDEVGGVFPESQSRLAVVRLERFFGSGFAFISEDLDAVILNQILLAEAGPACPVITVLTRKRGRRVRSGRWVLNLAVLAVWTLCGYWHCGWVMSLMMFARLIGPGDSPTGHPSVHSVTFSLNVCPTKAPIRQSATKTSDRVGATHGSFGCQGEMQRPTWLDHHWTLARQSPELRTRQGVIWKKGCPSECGDPRRLYCQQARGPHILRLPHLGGQPIMEIMQLCDDGARIDPPVFFGRGI
jgi:hypothetical protein